MADKHLGLKRKLNKVIDQIHGEKVPRDARSAIETDGTASVFLYRFGETAAIQELGIWFAFPNWSFRSTRKWSQVILPRLSIF